MKGLIRFAKSKNEINKFLPDYCYSKEPNREWLWNVINALIPEEFQDLIKIKVEKRNREIVKSQNLGINASPEFIESLRNPKLYPQQKESLTF